MALSDNENRRSTKSTKNRNLYDAGKQWWSDNQKLECVQTYLLTGNAAMTGRMLKIPEDTVRRWKQTQWWMDIEADLRIQDTLMTTARQKKIIDKTFEVVEDRLENGDWVYDQKTGALRRKGVSLKDAHKVGMDLTMLREKMLDRSGPSVTEERVEEKLETLAAKFAAMVNSKITPPVDVVDAEIIEVSSSEEEMQGHPDSPPDEEHPPF